MGNIINMKLFLGNKRLIDLVFQLIKTLKACTILIPKIRFFIFSEFNTKSNQIHINIMTNNAHIFNDIFKSIENQTVISILNFMKNYHSDKILIHLCNQICLTTKNMQLCKHSSLVEYLAQVIFGKNYPNHFYCIFHLVWVPMSTTQNIRGSL